ncbi:hypothetical protein TPY_2158 [Sulfobacillus acidophilus TPY]|uniref:Uncharacterized protein n=1 Tax=Sulfobacillus acidophilus (strain ATCC 700253 / DSM 10332 / NAL) TaxID=679936 RepID=G8TZB1_SULAD|nr:hypothetical protein TPY_2158 [Sulfobacillus acidophilus TPY]AEW04080.1 hypothetical protein Sulac_0539 [Sulfobacillus acidophilus DSM 10332]
MTRRGIIRLASRELGRRWPGALGLFGVGMLRGMLEGTPAGSPTLPRVLARAWQGVPPHASILFIFLWMVVPLCWGLIVGEPWVLDRPGWHRMVAIRVRTRWAWWSGTLVALFASAIPATGLLLGGSLMAAIGIHHVRWSTTLWPTLGNLAVMLLEILWAYLALLIAFSMISRRPGGALMATLGLGYLANAWLPRQPCRSWVPPLAGQYPMPTLPHDVRAAGGVVIAVLFITALYWGHWRKLSL